MSSIIRFNKPADGSFVIISDTNTFFDRVTIVDHFQNEMRCFLETLGSDDEHFDEELVNYLDELEELTSKIQNRLEKQMPDDRAKILYEVGIT